MSVDSLSKEVVLVRESRPVIVDEIVVREAGTIKYE